MTLHIGYKSPFRTNPLPTNLSGNGSFFFYMVFEKRSGLQRSVFSQSFHIFRPFFKVPSLSKAATAGATVPASGGYSAENGVRQKFRLQKVGNQIQPEGDVQDAAVFTGAENRQCRGTVRTYSGGNGTLSCHGGFHQGGRSTVDRNCCAENSHSSNDC